MPELNQPALNFLLTRRSRPAKTLALPVPSRAELKPILTAALRTPDHGKLEPWRLIVLERAALLRLASHVGHAGVNLGKAQAGIDKATLQFETAHLVVVVIEVQKPSEKIPEIEQTYSAGAVCLALLNAALASGWGANWLSGWPSHERGFVKEGLSLKDHERVAGLIHIGTEVTPPPERPRPDPEQIITWMDQ